MPKQTVESVKLLRGKRLTVIDKCGGVFTPIPGKVARPAYAYGPANAKTRDLMFQCPVSAIPFEVWDLLMAWWKCRNLGLPYRAGGAEDQPGIVQWAFPFFEAEMRTLEAARGGPDVAAAAAVGAMFKLMGGGGGKR